MERQFEQQEGGFLWDGLKARVEAGEITTSGGEPYTTKELEEAMDAARASRFSIMNLFTRNEGVRSEAASLLISEAQSFEELTRLLKEVNEVEGSDGTIYTGEQIATEVANVASIEAANEEVWDTFYNRLTRTYGLRDAVKRCVANRSDERMAA